MTNNRPIAKIAPCGPAAPLWPLLLLVFILHSSVFAQQEVSPLPPITDGSVSSPLKIKPGDQIDVKVFDTPELSLTKIRVDENGRISLPIAGEIAVAGMSPAEAGQAIATKLREGRILLNPTVTVVVSDYANQGIKVVGEVRVPGTYLLLGQHSLYDALSAAGGTTHDMGRTIVVTHASDPLNPVIVPVNSPNYSEEQRRTTVRPGDLIVVSRADKFYVIGDVAHPGEFLIEAGRPLTVLNAIALAQGLNPTAASSKASIVRPTVDGGAITIKLDLKQIERNKALNTVMEPADVLVVPRSGFKQFLSYTIPNSTAAVIGSVAAAAVR